MIVRMQEVSGEQTQGGGVVWRMIDENNYYVALWDALRQSVEVAHVSHGVKTRLGIAELVDSGAAGWRVLQVDQVGEKITVTLNHKPILHIKNEALDKPGHIGICTENDAVIKFRELEIRAVARMESLSI